MKTQLDGIREWHWISEHVIEFQMPLWMAPPVGHVRGIPVQNVRHIGPAPYAAGSFVVYRADVR